MPDEQSMIEDLRELESELREKGEYRKANIIDLFIRYSTHCKVNKSVIKEKIEELKERPNKMVIDRDIPEEYKNIFLDEHAINVLQELLEG